MTDNSHQDITKKVIESWKNIGRIDFENHGIEAMSGIFDSRIKHVQVDTHNQIAPILRDNLNYYAGSDLGSEPIPLVIVIQGNGVAVDKQGNKKLITAPELWIPGACAQYPNVDNIKHFFKSVIEKGKLAEPYAFPILPITGKIMDTPPFIHES